MESRALCKTIFGNSLIEDFTKIEPRYKTPKHTSKRQLNWCSNESAAKVKAQSPTDSPLSFTSTSGRTNKNIPRTLSYSWKKKNTTFLNRNPIVWEITKIIKWDHIKLKTHLARKKSTVWKDNLHNGKNIAGYSSIKRLLCKIYTKTKKLDPQKKKIWSKVDSKSENG